MKKIIYIPDDIALSKGSKAWNLMRTGTYAKLRDVCPELLSDDELRYLRDWFEEYVMLTDEEVVLHYVEEDDPLSISMMTAAAFELSGLMLNRNKR